MEGDVKRVHVERSRKFGGPWLGLELLRRLELEVRITPAPGGAEVCSLCRSAQRQAKEQAMHRRILLQRLGLRLPTALESAAM